MFHGTTVVAVRRDGRLAMGSDGQVTQEAVILKHGAQKVRRLGGGRVLAGFAGSVADALTLFEKFEGHLQQTGGRLPRAAVELAKEWRTDRVLRRLEALMLVGDPESLLLISGGGEVIEPDEPVMAIGSGGPYALAAGRALLRNTPLGAGEIVRQSLLIAAEICIYTNDHVTVEELG
ncbi:MAG: ATP-dependent protease subunit HslV [Bacillota bacterium]|nr:ATP-dependent protease subunit HslV [Bacillota bacterium]